MSPTISFEFFPPKTDKGEEAFWPAVEALRAFDPKYMTVTYGAGGSTKDKTLEITSKMAGQGDVPIASHLTFLSTKKPDLDAYVDALWDNNVKHIVALRGDLPEGASYDDFKGDEYYDYTSNFVIALKQRHDFFISVGAYPEKHPDAPSMDADIHALWRKCEEADADQAITQFFFDNDIYYRFVDQCRAKDITKPIYPGLLPIHDFESMKRFAGRCNTAVPDWLHEKFDGLQDKPEEAAKVATELLIKQALDLQAQGVEHIHIYTLNKKTIAEDACRALLNG